MMEKIKQNHIPLANAITKAKVPFNSSDLEKALKDQIEENGTNLEKLFPKVGSEALAKLLVKANFYHDITSAYEAICLIRRISDGLE